MTQPSSGWLASIPSGSVMCSVVSELTRGAGELAWATGPACRDDCAPSAGAPVSVSPTRVRGSTPAAAARIRRVSSLLVAPDRCDEAALRRSLSLSLSLILSPLPRIRWRAVLLPACGAHDVLQC